MGIVISKLSSMALHLLAGERISVPLKLSGILQESLITVERVLASGLDLNFEANL